jgi:hypothetical protein
VIQRIAERVVKVHYMIEKSGNIDQEMTHGREIGGIEITKDIITQEGRHIMIKVTDMVLIQKHKVVEGMSVKKMAIEHQDQVETEVQRG